MKNKIIFKIVFLLIIAMIFTSCDYNHVKSQNQNFSNADKATLENPDFVTVNALVFVPRCLGCHTDSTGNKGGVNLDGYKNVRSWLGKIDAQTREFVPPKMPPKPNPPLSGDEIALLSLWLDSGAPFDNHDKFEKPNPNLENGPISWLKVRDYIFAAKCFDCHSQPEPAKGLDLTTLKPVKENILKIIDRVIILGDMPISPYPAVTPRERRALLKWINAGLPE